MSEAHDDFAGEPVYGLPEELPEGENILWQGSPDRWEVATRIFHFRLIAAYFIVLAVWDIATAFRDGVPLGTLAYGLFGFSLAAAATLIFVWWLSVSTAREAVYTITEKRLVLRIGMALQISLNLPFTQINDAAVLQRRNGSGDIALTLVPDQKVSWLALWPHCRPWQFSRPKPALRCLPQVSRVAEVLGSALAAQAPGAVGSSVVEQSAQSDEQFAGAFG
jgi:hypothetical protein